MMVSAFTYLPSFKPSRSFCKQMSLFPRNETPVKLEEHSSGNEKHFSDNKKDNKKVCRVFPGWSFSSQKLVYREETSVTDHGLCGRKLI